MPAAGTVGFGDRYKALLDFEKLGAAVTNPVTIEPWNPASGTRMVPLDAGILVHTGLPNPGLSRVISQYRRVWAGLSVPVILHLVATTIGQVKQAVELIDEVDEIAAVELGLNDDISESEATDLVEEAAKMEKPLIVRLPFYECYQLALPIADAGADALVLTAAPRGTARDKHTGPAGQRTDLRTLDQANRPAHGRQVAASASTGSACYRLWWNSFAARRPRLHRGGSGGGAGGYGHLGAAENAGAYRA